MTAFYVITGALAWLLAGLFLWLSADTYQFHHRKPRVRMRAVGGAAFALGVFGFVGVFL